MSLDLGNIKKIKIKKLGIKSFFIKPKEIYRKIELPKIDRRKLSINNSNMLPSKKYYNQNMSINNKCNYNFKSRWIHSFSKQSQDPEIYNKWENSFLKQQNFLKTIKSNRKTLQVSIRITDCPMIITDINPSERHTSKEQSFNKLALKKFFWQLNDKKFQTELLNRFYQIPINR